MAPKLPLPRGWKHRVRSSVRGRGRLRPISLPPSTCCLALRYSSMTAAINVLNSTKNLSILECP